MALAAPGESLRDIFGRFWPCKQGDRCRLLAAGLRGPGLSRPRRSLAATQDARHQAAD
jgi:hypothetical protein